jgi:hypothetical protein
VFFGCAERFGSGELSGADANAIHRAWHLLLGSTAPALHRLTGSTPEDEHHVNRNRTVHLNVTRWSSVICAHVTMVW